jgi:glucosamine--fructose-6-phosphate aminotransferase (isomerizing)
VTPAQGRRIIRELQAIPAKLNSILAGDGRILEVAEKYAHVNQFLFMGRQYNFPIALEGALKLKEISYIHAEGYPAGEMKHGPIALIDEQMPVVALAPRDHVFEKMLSNIQEVKARGGSIIALTTGRDELVETLLDTEHDSIISLPETRPRLSPVVMVLPLQLLAYHIAVRRGCDVDQPRNLAKSVTVE